MVLAAATFLGDETRLTSRIWLWLWIRPVATPLAAAAATPSETVCVVVIVVVCCCFSIVTSAAGAWLCVAIGIDREEKWRKKKSDNDPFDTPFDFRFADEESGQRVRREL